MLQLKNNIVQSLSWTMGTAMTSLGFTSNLNLVSSIKLFLVVRLAAES